MHRLKSIYRGRKDPNPVYEYKNGVITKESLELLLDDIFLEIDIIREMNQALVDHTHSEPIWIDL